MELFDNLMLGFTVAFTPENLLYALLGCVLGTLIGVLPGIGPVPTIAMLLPITYVLPPVAGLIMLAGIYYGAQYGGSTTAILVALPGETSAVVTVLDGHQMARNGRAGAALAIAALGSFFAGCVATLLLAAFAPPLAEVAFKFGPAEYFSLMCLGLVGAVVLASGSLPKAIAMIILGLLLGMVGTDVNSGVARFDFGVPELQDGIDFAIVAMGVFGFAEIMTNLEQKENRVDITDKIGSLYPNKQGVQGIVSRGAPRHGPGLCAGHPAGRWRRAVVVRVVHAGKEDLAQSGTLRQGPSGRPGRPGIGQQCRRSDLVHPAADAGHPR